MYKLPIGGTRKPYLTQAFGNNSNAQWYASNGIFTPHNGTDWITGNPVETYGTELICPFPSAKVVKINFDSPMSTKGNGVTLEYRETKGARRRLQIVLWHTGEIKVKLGDTIKDGDVVCYIGNSGLCRPASTTARPYDGSHLHFMLYIDGVLTDPLKMFSKENWYIREDADHTHDVAPINWSTEKMGLTNAIWKFFLARRWWF